jgi:hypothetical protein
VRLAGEVSPDFNEEKIHKIRTTIKKMRAIGVWANRPVKKFFENYYKLLGEIRDAQLLLSKINSGVYVVPITFTNWLVSSLHHLKAEWQQKFDGKKAKKQLMKLADTLDNKRQHGKHSLKFEKNKNESLASFMHARPISDDQIHRGRKTIKQIDFLNKWEKRYSAGQMKKLSDEAGNFMDRISAIRLLERYIAQETDASKKKDAELVLENWKSSKDLEKDQLLKSIDLLRD